MCTVSWVFRDARLSVVFNRDESRRRAPGLPPRIGGAGAWTAPVDPEGGGTWIAAHARGLVVSVLNHTPVAGVAREPVHPSSRGGLVPRLVACGDLARVEEELRVLDTAPFRPFEILAVGGDGAALHAVWDGAALVVRRPGTPGCVTTSSFDTAAVVAARREAWERAGVARAADPFQAQEAFHRGREPGRGAYSVNMARPDARTVSRTAVVVTPERVVLRTVPLGDDGAEGEPAAVELARAAG